MNRTHVTLLIVVGVGLFSVPAWSRQEAPPADGSAGTVVVVNPPKPRTRLEELTTLKGALVIQRFADVRAVQSDDGGAVQITAAQFTNTLRKTPEYGLVFTVGHANGRTATVYLDEDEIDGLSTAIADEMKLDRNSDRATAFQAVYRTRGDLEIANIDSDGGRAGAVRATQILYPSGQLLNATVNYRLGRLSEIQDQIAAGKDAIEKMKAGAVEGK
jgi:hypothetical protein